MKRVYKLYFVSKRNISKHKNTKVDSTTSVKRSSTAGVDSTVVQPMPITMSIAETEPVGSGRVPVGTLTGRSNPDLPVEISI